MTSVSTPQPVSTGEASPAGVRTVHYVFSTHWDREWYQPFQHYRFRLVRLIDDVLAGIKDGRFAGPFQMDGQAILLDDYLEVRQQRRAEVTELVRNGRFIIGPWYVLPDEFLVSGESIVRNLRRGRAVARRYGAEPSTAGFVCDLFGHVSQLPQILAGFGVRGVFLWRGVNPRGTRHLNWRGADGTTLPAYHFGRRGYCDFASDVRSADKFDQRPSDEQVGKAIDTWLEREAGLTALDPVLAFDGGDHQEWDQTVYTLLRERADAADEPLRIRHSSLDAYLDEMLPQAGRITEEVVGELREPGREPWEVDEQWVIPGVASSRVWIKQRNAYCQTLLTRWAEPLAVLAGVLLGDKAPTGYLDVAWGWLLKNHPHDSIGGCSVDRVHEDMKFRFSQCELIGEQLRDDYAMRLTAAVAGEVDQGQIRLGVFNPKPRPVNGVVRLHIDIPTDWPSYQEFFGYEPKPAFRLFDAAGQEVAYQLIGIEPDQMTKRIDPVRFPVPRHVHRVEVAARLDLPALGFGVLTAKRGETNRPTRHSPMAGLAIDDRTLESPMLRVEATAGGTLRLTDRRTGRVYERLLTFEDAADLGDGWYHGPPINDQAISSADCASEAAVVADGPMMAALRIRTTMRVPMAFDAKRRRRSDERVEMTLDTTVRLYADRDELDLETTVDNPARDHRLRVLLPSGCAAAATCFSDSAFDVVERDIALRPDNHVYRELEIETRPHQSWTAVQDDTGGLAVVADGMLEAAVRDQPQRPVALTLFRSTGRTVLTAGEPDGQLLGPMTFRYRIVPLSGGLGAPRLFDTSADLAAGLHVAHVYPDDHARQREGADAVLPTEASLLRVEGDAVLTALLPREDGFEVRLFNPLGEKIHVKLYLPTSITGGRPCRVLPLDLAGDPLGEDALQVDGGAVLLELKPKVIGSYAVVPGRAESE